MKTKKITALLSLLLCGSLLCLTACSDNEKINFSNNWNEYPSNIIEGLIETTIYQVSGGTPENYTGAYNLSYDGTYKTQLKHLSEDGNDFYEYYTWLDYKVTYTWNGETITHEKDYSYSYVKFKDATQGLVPVSSWREFSSHTPRNEVNVGCIEECWGGTKEDPDKGVIEYKTEISYGENNQATYTRIQGAENFDVQGESELKKGGKFDYSGDKLSYLDNEQLIFAFRALDKSTTSTTVAVFSPFAGAQKFTLAFDSNDTKENFTFTKFGKSTPAPTSETGSETNSETASVVSKPIAYRTGTLSLKAKFSGPSYTVKVANSETEARNSNRNVILEIQSPLSNNMGTIVYKLTSWEYNK